MDTPDVQPDGNGEAELEDGSAVGGSLPGEPVDGDPDGDPDSEPELDEDVEEEADEADLTESELGGYDDDDDDDQQQALSGGPPATPADLESLVHYVASGLVSDPGAIEISSEQRGGTVYLRLRVPETDLGRVIGREGRTAKAIRTLVSIAGSKSHLHARLDIDG